MVLVSTTSGHSGHQRSHHSHSHSLKSRVRALESEFRSEKPENKVFDTFIASAAITETAVITSLNAIPLDTSASIPSTRIGQQVRGHTLYGKLNMYCNDTNSFIRVIIFTWKDVLSSAYPGVNNILEDSANNGVFGDTVAITFDSLYSNEFKKCFTVHMDKTYAMSTNGPQAFCDEIHLSLGGSIILFENDIDAGVTPVANPLFIFTISNTTDNAPTMETRWRYMFTDA